MSPYLIMIFDKLLEKKHRDRDKLKESEGDYLYCEKRSGLQCHKMSLCSCFLYFSFFFFFSLVK